MYSLPSGGKEIRRSSVIYKMTEEHAGMTCVAACCGYVLVHMHPTFSEHSAEPKPFLRVAERRQCTGTAGVSNRILHPQNKAIISPSKAWDRNLRWRSLLESLSMSRVKYIRCSCQWVRQQIRQTVHMLCRSVRGKQPSD